MIKKHSLCDNSVSKASEDYVFHLYQIFDTLDIILISFQSKQSKFSWKQIWHAFNLMSTATISLEDISAIMTIWPSAYNIYWSSDSDSKEDEEKLHITMGNSTTSSSSTSLAELRKSTFRFCLRCTLFLTNSLLAIYPQAISGDFPNQQCNFSCKPVCFPSLSD